MFAFVTNFISDCKAGINAVRQDLNADFDSIKSAQGFVATSKAVVTSTACTLLLRIGVIVGSTYVACVTSSTVIAVISVLTIAFVIYSIVKKDKFDMMDIFDLAQVSVFMARFSD